VNSAKGWNNHLRDTRHEPLVQVSRDHTFHPERVVNADVCSHDTPSARQKLRFSTLASQVSQRWGPLTNNHHTKMQPILLFVKDLARRLLLAIGIVSLIASSVAGRESQISPLNGPLAPDESRTVWGDSTNGLIRGSRSGAKRATSCYQSGRTRLAGTRPFCASSRLFEAMDKSRRPERNAFTFGLYSEARRILSRTR
jgi:hypothetical protein